MIHRLKVLAAVCAAACSGPPAAVQTAADGSPAPKTPVLEIRATLTHVIGPCQFIGAELAMFVDGFPGAPQIRSRPGMPCRVGSDDRSLHLYCREFVEYAEPLLNHWDAFSITLFSNGGTGAVHWIKEGGGEWSCVMGFKIQ